MSDGTEMITGMANASATTLKAIADYLTQVAIENKREHGQQLVAKAILANKPCVMYEFDADNNHKLDKKEMAKRTALINQLNKKAIPFAEVKRDDGTTVVIVRESDIDLVHEAIARANEDITRAAVNKNPNLAKEKKHEKERGE